MIAGLVVASGVGPAQLIRLRQGNIGAATRSGVTGGVMGEANEDIALAQCIRRRKTQAEIIDFIQNDQS